MLSFVSGRIDDSRIATKKEDVWILYRMNHQSCLIIGAFASREAAFDYVEHNGPADLSAWTEPHPGQRFWQFQSELFTYQLESHQLRQERDGADDRQAALSSGRSAN